MSLPLPAIDRLFDRLTATYGRQFIGMYEGLDSAAVKTAWAHELSGFARQLQAVAWALENLPERAPNVIEFRALCRRAPAPDVPKLPEPKADPERVRRELAKLGDFRRPLGNTDCLAWARRIVSRRQQGERIALGTYNIAAEALRMNGVKL